jgi:Uma2 family endonuclease
VSSLRQTEHYSLEEYFALERASERRFEYRNGDIVCRSGGSIEHATIASNFVLHLRTKLRGGSSRVYGSDLAVYVPGGIPYRYPDVSVVCGEPAIEIVDGRDCLRNPILIVEVLSPTTADYDRGTKFEEYKSIPTLTDYLLVAQEHPHIVRRTRHDPNTWHEMDFTPREGPILLDAIGVNLDMREVYEGLSFS